MIVTVRRRQFDTRAVRWTGSNEAEVRELCPDFHAIDVEDRGDDPDATGELWDFSHGRRVFMYDGDHIVLVPGGARRYTDDEYVAEFEPVTA
ncbi:hypothetical protein ABT369_38760 [Dactylosporangium sp. NPDC000244]|uniref:hypothetical protein n=1 Tax=Dactylosporangium sp. NPDC000244 TaxID=3154365 RepID=UPI003329F6D0